MEKNTNTTTPRTTKAMYYADILALLKEEPAPYNIPVEDRIEFIEHELDLLAKKNSKTTKKPTATQEANEEYKAQILDFLTLNPGSTCMDINRGVPALVDFNNQKVAALLRQLRLAGQVYSDKAKGKSVFFLTDGAEVDAE